MNPEREVGMGIRDGITGEMGLGLGSEDERGASAERFRSSELLGEAVVDDAWMVSGSIPVAVEVTISVNNVRSRVSVSNVYTDYL
jgi:hypothetical protein